MLRKHAGQLVAKLEGMASHDEGIEFADNMERSLAEIQEKQLDTGTGEQGITTEEHIRAHGSNVGLLECARQDLGRLENLVLGTGQDTGAILGQCPSPRKPQHLMTALDDIAKTAVIEIQVKNMSARHKRKVPEMKRYLPPEIREPDVLDAGGLEFGTDAERGLTYVFKRNLELAPLAELKYEVRIRDKWDINEPRIRKLKAMADSVRKRVSAHRTFDSIELALAQIVNELEHLSTKKGPKTVDDHYVAFYRGQTKALDDLESRLNRLIWALPSIESSSGIKASYPHRAARHQN